MVKKFIYSVACLGTVMFEYKCIVPTNPYMGYFLVVFWSYWAIKTWFDRDIK